jgi:hypothetical protein
MILFLITLIVGFVLFTIGIKWIIEILLKIINYLNKPSKKSGGGYIRSRMRQKGELLNE